MAALNRREDEDVVVDSVFKLLMVSWLLVEAMMTKHSSILDGSGEWRRPVFCFSVLPFNVVLLGQ